MGQFSNSFPKHFSYPCEHAIRFDLSCSFCEYPFIFHCLHCSPSCFGPDSLLLAHLWLGVSWIDCISANKRFSSPKTSSRKPYTSSKQQERQKHSVETTINFSRQAALHTDPQQAADGASSSSATSLPGSAGGPLPRGQHATDTRPREPAADQRPAQGVGGEPPKTPSPRERGSMTPVPDTGTGHPTNSTRTPRGSPPQLQHGQTDRARRTLGNNGSTTRAAQERTQK